MNEPEYIEVLSYLREKVRKSHYLDVDDVVAMETRSVENPRTRLENYLKMLIGMACERSNSRAIIINERLGKVLDIESGGKFEGVEIQLSPPEIETFGMSRFTLSELDEVGEFVDQLEIILADIHNEPDPADSGNNMDSQS